MSVDPDKLCKIKRTRYHYISMDGRVYNMVTGNWLKSTMHRGNMRCMATENGKYYNISVGYEVASAFVDNPNNYTSLKYIDGNRSNCDSSNLEWCRRMVVSRKGDKVEPMTIRCKCTDITDMSVVEYDTIIDLCNKLRLSQPTLLSLAKSSNDHPIRGRYIVSVNESDIEKLGDMYKACAVLIYVYDVVTGMVEVHGSKSAASYYTGINLSRRLNKYDDVYSELGYVISRNPKLAKGKGDKIRSLGNLLEYECARDEYNPIKHSSLAGYSKVGVYYVDTGENVVYDNAKIAYDSVVNRVNGCNIGRSLFYSTLSRAYSAGEYVHKPGYAYGRIRYNADGLDMDKVDISKLFNS